MIDGIRLKICGLTTLADANFSAQSGADALGFIFYPKSPRAISIAQYIAMAASLSQGSKRVAVMVEPSSAELAAAVAAGFDFFQIHFDTATVGLATVAVWSQTVGSEGLWLAPKLREGESVGAELLPLADTLLMDTYKADGFGGTGRTGDWAGFARQQEAHPEKTWILAGGLNPENITAALTETGATFVDVNSGVESSPGVKDHEKIRRLAAAVHRLRTKA